ncbi:hypothetical protein COCON_G00228190 [Conger conger]|uniref:Uncharacterized protein n=1 Tax=Conger conger TaxID=82655 RepID=A0A9Q1HMH6_CONCO|nr:hypothetical protein COCON_G00228190 [Conger conger]
MCLVRILVSADTCLQPHKRPGLPVQKPSAYAAQHQGVCIRAALWVEELTVWVEEAATQLPTLGDRLVSPFGTVSPPPLGTTSSHPRNPPPPGTVGTVSPPPFGTTNVAQVRRSGIRTSNLYLPSEVNKVIPQKWKI